jgi:hypothetical protein
MAGAAAKFSLRFILYRLLPAVVLLLAGGIILFASYLASPGAAAKLSAILTSTLDLPVTVAAIGLQGDTLTFQGVAVGNPPGFAATRLVSVRAVSLAPDWLGVLRGHRSLRLLSIDGVRLDLRKGSAGGWNFEKIRQRFSAGKGGGAELFIGDLRISDGDILVNGKGLRGISLKLRNVATKGSAGATAVLAFDDDSGNRYNLTGSFRAGAVPAAELSLEAPSLALAGLAGAGKRVTVAGKGSLRVNAALHEGMLRSAVAATFTGVTVKLRTGGEIPLSGSLRGSATYDLKRDLLTLEQGALLLDEILEMNASGSVTSVKSDARYDLALGINRFDIAKGAALLPGLRRTGTKAAGTVSAREIRITGDRHHGVASASGVISLRDLLLERNGRLLLHGIGTDLKIATAGNTIRAVGELTRKDEEVSPLLESLRAPYALVFTTRMKPKSVVLPGFTARVAGTPLSGSFSFRPEDKAPFSLSLQLPENRLKAMSYGDFTLATGTAGMALALKGAGSTDFSGSVTLQLADLDGSSKGERFTLGSAALKADFKAIAGRYSAAGDGAFDRSAFKGVAAGGRFAFTLADDLLQLEKCAFKVADATITAARLSTLLPRKAGQQASGGYPLDVKVAGGAVSRGELQLAGISGSLRGDYAGAAGAKSFTGSGSIAAEKLLWRGREIGAPRAAIALSRSSGTITLAGAVLGGTMGGTVSFNPAAAAAGAAFDLSLKEVALAQLAKVVVKKGSATLAGGQLLVTTRGNYSRRDGITCRVRGEGTGISVAAAGGKVLLADAGLAFDGSLARGDVKLADALLRIGEGATVQLKGEVARALSSQREGTITGRLSRTPLSRIVDPLVNGLPRLLQEAAVSGEVAAEGSLGFRNGRTTVRGSLQLAGAGIDAPSRKLRIADVSGSIPFALGFPARPTPSPAQSTVLKRESYGEQLALFSRRAATGSLVKIGTIAFGPLEFGETALRLKAEEGIIEALSFSSSLTTGKILGQGYVAFSKGASYGGDLLLNNLSLQQVCALFPAIKGYVSGRVDGIAMFEGRGGSSSGLNGYTYFWTRPGDGEKMLVSKEFLQKLAGKNLKGFLFRNDRPFDKGEVMASLASGYLTFDILDIENTNFFGIRDLKVTVTESQNRIGLEHLLSSISQAVSRGKGAAGKGAAGKEAPAEAAPPPTFKWDE